MSGEHVVHTLQDNQMRAVAPEETVWLSASAGTGKTQVLSARVLRLLLQPGVDPSAILCLTFTRAGAAEMASRINDQLARWVRLKDDALATELGAIGADVGQPALARARTLFASVLDCPGGGLRIDTIHAFAQWLLGTFPFEAGLTPGTRAMEDRDRALLLRQVLADLLVHAESDPLGDPQLLDAVADLSLRHGPDAVEAFLLRCASAGAGAGGARDWQPGAARAIVLRLLGLQADADDSLVAELCGDIAFDVPALRHCAEVNREWGTKTGLAIADAIAAWLALNGPARAGAIDDLHDAFFTQKGALRSSSSQEKLDPDYPSQVADVAECIVRVRDTRTLLDLADRLVPALRLGRAFALAWDEAKAREGLIDFDDQIRQAARLLSEPGLGDWIRYKLDRQFDHILVDEAQDTNAAQWRIILDGLAGEFWSGIGQRDGALRTLFVVGDYKQAIFRFQGTSPENFEKARNRVRDEMAGAARNAEMLRSNLAAKRLRELDLGQSFRTAHNVLEFVDRAIAHIGHQGLGLKDPAKPHVGQKRSGYVALWRPVGAATDGVEDEVEDEGGEGNETWLSRPDREMADRIARQVRQWLDDGFVLQKYKRAAMPGDIMVLVRKRKDLAGLIVARLHAAGVPVAGVDRLRLGAPLAVQDVVAALRFAAQPFDDLNLAALLVSPLIGWSQQQLLQHGFRPRDEHLWSHLRRSTDPEVLAVRERLGELLRRADYEPPQALLHWLLSGPWQGRSRIVARLGHEANDPLDELVNAAHAYAMSDTASLAGFLAWFDAGEGELKREAGASPELVRVMTAHGSKGLQAPIVILADATGDPKAGFGPAAELDDPADPSRVVPLPPLRKEERIGRIAARHEDALCAEEEEHWRLLYVAMTRAEEALFIGGALGRRAKGEVPAGSWFAKLRELFGQDDWVDDALFGSRLEWGTPPAMGGPRVAGKDQGSDTVLPVWLTGPPPEEPRPPRPLAPSRLGEDVSADPPFASGGSPAAMRAAARRGVLVHGLLERLPEVPPEARAMAGERWLMRNGAELAPGDRDELLASALAVLDDPGFADLFLPGSLAEVPIAALVGGRVVAGTIDRLLVERERILVVDYKTARRPPADITGVPVSIMRQMAAYAAALERTYPGRQVEAALLYTATPRLIAIPVDVLAAHKLALVAGE